MNVLEFATLAITGFVACAEFGSYAFVHPVIRRLSSTAHLQVEQGLLRTFGRVMPVGMTLCVVLAISSASRADGNSQLWHWLAVGAFVLALISTIVFNVPINLATGKWDAASPPADWKQTRHRWEFFQGLRSWLLLLGFILVCAGSSIG
ncbi:MAG: anthrone oxygenase family protein [Nocardioidaceae bacterium]